jgi:ribosomal protein S18 acetylase RimI-like enzyme
MESSTITIRPATDEDAVAIADFSRLTFNESFGPYNTEANMQKFMNERFTRTKLAAEIYDRSNHFFIAVDNGEICGYVKLKESESPQELGNIPSIELARIYTTQNRVGKGIGRLLMGKAIEFARSRNKQALWLGVWEHNERAISFYRKWGFERFSQHPFTLGDDIQTDWLMKKELD